MQLRVGLAIPKDAHCKEIVDAVGVSAGYLREYDGYCESDIARSLMKEGLGIAEAHSES